MSVVILFMFLIPSTFMLKKANNIESIRISLNIKKQQQHENYGEERHINIQYRNTEK